MEIFDCFCGVGAWSTRDRILPYQPEEILRLMDHFGIQKALVYHNAMKYSGLAPDSNQVIPVLLTMMDAGSVLVAQQGHVSIGKPNLARHIDEAIGMALSRTQVNGNMRLRRIICEKSINDISLIKHGVECNGNHEH